MTDRVKPSGVNPPDREIDPGPPIEELALLAEEPVKDISADVVEEINVRMLGGQIVDVQWWGLTTLVQEYLSFMLENTVENSTDDPESQKEK